VNTAVIGSGFGGIASALRMRALGHDVTLFEKLSEIGGRAQVFNRGPYLHDAGPTVITAPYLFNELFELFDENLEDHLDFRSLDPWYRYYFVDGFEFDYTPNSEKMISQIRDINPADVDNYQRMLKAAREIFEIGYVKLADQPFHKFTTMMKYTPDIIRLKGYKSVYAFVASFLKDPNLRKVFTIQPLLVGGNPFKTSAIYALIQALEQKWGIYFCMGGMGKVIQELESLMLRHGIQIRKDTCIEKFSTVGKTISQIHTNSGEGLVFDNVICNSDPVFVNTKLLKSKRVSFHNSYIKKFAKHSMGLFVIFFGSRKKFKKVAHHTIWMGPRYKSLLEDIFEKQVLADDFSIYLHRPTATDQSFAKNNGDSFYALIPVPNMKSGIQWSDIKEEYALKVIGALNETILPGINESIEDLFVMTPDDFKENYLTPYGSGFSISPILSQSAWFRTHNKDDYYKNLYYSGAGSHPGAGVPGVLNSAKVVENIFTNDKK